jgi:fatty acid desaturase
MTEFKRRDYRIGDEETEKAFAKGLVNEQGYITPIQRERLKKLLVCKDGPAIRDTMIWLAVLIGAGALAYLSWGRWWIIL